MGMRFEVDLATTVSLAEPAGVISCGLAIENIHSDMILEYLRVINSISHRVSSIQKDDCGDSVLGRRRRLDRLPCQWMKQCFGSPQGPPIYPQNSFRDKFGLPKALFTNILFRLGTMLDSGSAADGRRGHLPEV